MHSTRLMAIIGSVIGVIGLFMKALSTAAPAEVMAGVNAANPDFPASVPTIWAGLDTWAQVVLVILIAVVVVLAVLGVRDAAMDRNSSIIVAVIGIALFAYAVIKWMDTSDKAEQVAGGLAQAAQGGMIPEAYSVGTGAFGFVMLLIGTGLVTVAGAMGLAKKSA